MGEQVGRQERDQGDGRRFTLGGRAGGRTQGQLTTFLKIASSTSTLLLSVYFLDALASLDFKLSVSE